MEHTLSEEEIKDLAISTIGLGLAFSLLYFGGAAPQDFVLSLQFIPALVVATALVAISFIPHEMGHRVTARSMDAYAEYEMWKPGVALAVLSSFLGAVAAAPGGVKMYTRSSERYGLSVPQLNLKMIGYVAIVGPLMNISLAVIFSFLATSIPTSPQLYGVDLLFLGARINGFLAVFNLMPFHPLDGYKIIRWNTTIWAVTLAMALLTFILI